MQYNENKKDQILIHIALCFILFIACTQEHANRYFVGLYVVYHIVIFVLVTVQIHTIGIAYLNQMKEAFYIISCIEYSLGLIVSCIICSSRNKIADELV